MSVLGLTIAVLYLYASRGPHIPDPVSSQCCKILIATCSFLKFAGSSYLIVHQFFLSHIAFSLKLLSWSLSSNRLLPRYLLPTASNRRLCSYQLSAFYVLSRVRMKTAQARLLPLLCPPMEFPSLLSTRHHSLWVSYIIFLAF